jgi:hypothetical protein
MAHGRFVEFTVTELLLLAVSIGTLSERGQY